MGKGELSEIGAQFSFRAAVRRQFFAGKLFAKKLFAKIVRGKIVRTENCSQGKLFAEIVLRKLFAKIVLRKLFAEIVLRKTKMTKNSLTSK